MNVRIFKTRSFARWARKIRLPDESLLGVVDEIQNGLIDADLGGHLFKKRVALAGRGKRGGTRVIIATRMKDRWFFLAGFEKKDRDNLHPDELDSLKGYAQMLLNLDDTAADKLVEDEKLEELNDAP